MVPWPWMSRQESFVPLPSRRSIACEPPPVRVKLRESCGPRLPESHMGRFFDLVTDPLRSLGELAPAKPGAFADRGPSLLKLNSNESAYGPSPKALAAMRAVLESSHLYPDDHATELRRKLAEVHAIGPGSIFIANGTTALLGVIARTLLRPGLNAITSICSFISYPMVTNAAGAVLIETPLRNGGYDLDAILGAVNENTRIIFIANPNN